MMNIETRFSGMRIIAIFIFMLFGSAMAYPHAMVESCTMEMLHTCDGDMVVESPSQSYGAVLSGSEEFAMRISTKWGDSTFGVLRINGIEQDNIQGDGEKEYVLPVPANSEGVYECEWEMGETVYRKTIRTVSEKKTAYSSGGVTLDTMLQPRVAKEAGEGLVYDASWFEGGTDTRIKDNGAEIGGGVEGVCDWMPKVCGMHDLTLTGVDGNGETTGAKSASFNVPHTAPVACARIEPTFEEDGREAGTKCSRCGEYLSGGERIPKLREEIAEGVTPVFVFCEFEEGMTRPAGVKAKVVSGVDVKAEFDLAAEGGWCGRQDVTWSDGDEFWVEPLSGVRTEVTEHCARQLGATNIETLLLTKDGWCSFGNCTKATVVLTCEGWEQIGELTVGSYVAVQETAECKFFHLKARAHIPFPDASVRVNGYEGTYDGNFHGVTVSTEMPGVACRFALDKNADPDQWTTVSPTLKDAGTMTVWCEISAEGYVTRTNSAVVTIVPKGITGEMCVIGENAFFFDGEEKKPEVTVRDGEPNICTAEDYTLEYGTKTGAGLVPVTITGRRNYCGTVRKEFAILKRPVAEPVIGGRAYNGRTQRASVTADERWVVVKNDGGTDTGSYPVTLRLTNTEDYRWRSLGEDDAEWTGTFKITKAGNGWSRLPGIADWTEGEAGSEPLLGQPRYGATTAVEYRRRGEDAGAGTAAKPWRAGLYTARFIAAETANYAGTWMDVDFEIRRGAGSAEETTGTPAPVPHAWLERYVAKYGGGDYERAGLARGRNGVALWESYVAGLDPEDEGSRFRAKIEMGEDGEARVTWEPDLSGDAVKRKYVTYGCMELGGKWEEVNDGNRKQFRFFKVTVELEAK